MIDITRVLAPPEMRGTYPLRPFHGPPPIGRSGSLSSASFDVGLSRDLEPQIGLQKQCCGSLKGSKAVYH